MATDAMFIVRQMMERKLEFQQESSWGFLDLDKAYDKINREMIPPVLRQYHVPEGIDNHGDGFVQNTKDASENMLW